MNDRFKKNFALGVLNGSLVNFGMAFMDPFTVLPLFITRLGAGEFYVGLASGIAGAGWFLPQAFVSRLAETRSRLINMYRVTALARILSWAGLVAVLYTLDPGRMGPFLAAFLSLYALASVGGGLAAVPFLEITGKTIPVDSRGLFFGTRRLVGGTLGVGAGVVVGEILGGEGSGIPIIAIIDKAIKPLMDRLAPLTSGFPHNYALLFLLGASMLSLGLIAFCFVEEPPGVVTSGPRSLRRHFAEGFGLLWREKNYRLFYLVRLSWQLTAMAFPFYSSYAFKDLAFDEGVVGVFVALWVGSGVVSNYIWGRLLDRKGNRLVLTVTAALSIMPPLLILLLMAAAPSSRAVLALPLMVLSFLINGLIRSGRVISNITYLLEFAPVEKRPLYIGFMNSFTFPLMLSPALGGLIVSISSVQVLFGSSVLFALLDLILSLRLQEPRQRKAAA